MQGAVAQQPAMASAWEAQRVRDHIESWAGAWLRGDVPAYLRHYAAEFKGAETSRGVWERQRRVRLDRNDIDLALHDVNVSVNGNRASARFIQRYRAGSYRDDGTKELQLELRDGAWVIVGESFRAVR